MNSGPTTLDYVTLAIALLGAATGIGSLLWNIAAWRRSGPRIDVDSSLALLPGAGVGCLTIKASNVGRSPIQVTAMGFEDGKHYITTLNPANGSTPLPTTLNPGHDADFLIPAAHLPDLVDENDTHQLSLVPVVSLAGNRQARGKPLGLARGALRRFCDVFS